MGDNGTDARPARALLAWQRYGVNGEDSLANGNGRIEATEIDVATKIAGRIKEILVREGDFVTARQVLALMDTDTHMSRPPR